MSCMGSSFYQLIVGLDCQGGHHCVSSPQGSPEQGRKSLGEAWALLLFPANIQGGQGTHKWFHHLSGGVGAWQLNGLALLWSSQKVVTSFLATLWLCASLFRAVHSKMFIWVICYCYWSFASRTSCSRVSMMDLSAGSVIIPAFSTTVATPSFSGLNKTHNRQR